MKNPRLESIDIHLNEELKDKNFRKLYEMEKVKVALAQKIAVLREKENLRQVDLAKRLGVSQQFISQIETGEEKNLTLDTLVNIARALGCGIKLTFSKELGLKIV